MIRHDLSTAARFADRIAVMYLGRIVEEGPAAAVADCREVDPALEPAGSGAGHTTACILAG
jgi:ABC-type glutathione transport system ATPase component